MSELQMLDKDERPMCLKEAAAWLGMSDRTLARLTREKSIPFVKHGRRFYFSRRKLAVWAGLVDE